LGYIYPAAENVARLMFNVAQMDADPYWIDNRFVRV
jgi:hypothetical protein